MNQLELKEEVISLLTRLQQLGFEISGCGCCGCPSVYIRNCGDGDMRFDKETNVKTYVEHLLKD